MNQLHNLCTSTDLLRPGTRLEGIAAAGIGLRVGLQYELAGFTFLSTVLEVG